MKPETIIFDLDNTLIDTERIKIAIDGFLMNLYGLSREEARKIYSFARNNKGEVIFSRESFKKAMKNGILSRGVGYLDSDADTFFDGLNWESILLPGAREFIQYCQRKNIHIYLLSLGDITWQMDKIKGTGLDQFFNDENKNLILTSQEGEGKIEAIQRIFGDRIKQGEGMIIVNDKPDETAQIISKFSKMVALIREESRDDRYRSEMFSALQREFSGRVFVSNNLGVLQKELDNIIKREYEPNQENDKR